jgi:hypothetical protein
MADLDSTKADVEPIEDPIGGAQTAVVQAKALLQCIETTMEAGSAAFHYENVDLVSACSGVIGLLDKIVDSLDPGDFRKAVLASQSAEVSHG